MPRSRTRVLRPLSSTPVNVSPSATELTRSVPGGGFGAAPEPAGGHVHPAPHTMHPSAQPATIRFTGPSLARGTDILPRSASGLVAGASPAYDVEASGGEVSRIGVLRPR